ncbi:MAG: helix-turn-helix domain-containing protein [Rhodocyclaceae bacterium]|nr:helix-turn-helix domain-containing protein [Pseudomonadota bacterium]MDQ7971861.1 helix-turn-helix domain-containing protein [Rhodocyclaceae bacterium]MDQ7999772.1 helix-turn-helix domain-containing protein [Pseudomonadota bacterium]MDQ8016096.1 helix-turn-helix domain-containing protein [Pseudomonadota bacterium]
MNATDAPASEGLRERKQRETRQRIAELALRLFLEHGYDGTTLDAIASAAGISRRTFFSYFKSKDDIILFGMEADSAELIAELLKTSPDVPPLDAVRDVMVKRIARYTTEEMTAIDNLMLSSESLLARKQAFYAKQEQALFLALREVWRQPERQTALRMVAMASVGAMRLALQAWREQTGKRKPAAQFLRDAFDSLRTGL